jgi:hypothetical protein
MTPVDSIIGNPTVVNLATNANVQQQLQNNYALEFLHFRFTGNLTLASYTSAPAKYVESLENLLAFLQITATGKSAGATTDTLCNVDGGFLFRKTQIMEGTSPVRTDVGTANGAYAFETNFKRYFADPRSNASRLTMLYTAGLSSLTAAYQFRDQTAMVTGGTAGTATLNSAQITVQAREYLGVSAPTPSPYVKETQRTFNITQSQNGFVADKIPVGNVLRRQWFKGMLGAVNYADPSDSIFGATGKPEGPHVQLWINNATLKLDQVYQQLRADNKTLFGIETMAPGWAVYEPARNKKLINSLPFGNVANAQNNVDVNFTSGSINTLQITDEQIVGLSTKQFTANR